MDVERVAVDALGDGANFIYDVLVDVAARQKWPLG
jgi:hypothetical protein